MKKIIIILTLLTVLFAQELKKVGTTGFVFLELPTSARLSGMGDAGTTISDLNSQALFVNPSLAGFQDVTHSISFSFSPWLAETKHYVTSYSYHNSVFGTLSFGFILLDFGSMDKTVRIPGQRIYDKIGTFSAQSSALSVGYSRAITDKFSFGLALKYVNEKIDTYSADNILFDGGFIYWTGIGSLRVAGTLQNFGTNTTFNNKDFRMPILMKIGLAYDLLKNYDYQLSLFTDAIHPTDNTEKVNSGFEFSYSNMLFLRAGYKFNYDEESFTFGLGVKPTTSYPVSFDVSYTDFGRLNNVLRFNLQVGLQ